VSSPLGVLAIPVTLLVGLSFTGPIAAWAAHTQSDASFVALFRFVILPMFLFSGTFFPISNLPRPLEVVAWLTPLWHGVTLCRDLTLGQVSPADLLHLAYLVAFVAVGLTLARITYRRRLVE
jgi:lipooligosaccharide transport system permease protein